MCTFNSKLKLTKSDIIKTKNLKSLKLKKNTVSTFEYVAVNGGISGTACGGSRTACAPPTVVHTCQLTDEIGCTVSFVLCTS
ncbi:hypothetical protein [Kordia sp.]|uniref:hypothetical protein n=1 Tax=Kordia sp. TaxID=1965332 RepID=UPI0025C64925|nr:hypothetical protein [Kordia sp.]MCH2196993.1 hypothetical protein [Kordia sp.]